MTDQEYVQIATNDDPNGVTCGYCGQPNNYADDCGWFYAAVEPLQTSMHDAKSKPVCESCWKGIVGQIHIDMYGLGDR